MLATDRIFKLASKIPFGDDDLGLRVHLPNQYQLNPQLAFDLSSNADRRNRTKSISGETVNHGF